MKKERRKDDWFVLRPGILNFCPGVLVHYKPSKTCWKNNEMERERREGRIDDYKFFSVPGKYMSNGVIICLVITCLYPKLHGRICF